MTIEIGPLLAATLQAVVGIPAVAFAGVWLLRTLFGR